MRRLILAARICVLVLGVGVGAAHAQAPSIPPAPTYRPIDDNGVNLMSGQFEAVAPTLSIGPQAAGGLSYTRTLTVNGASLTWRDNFDGRNVRSCAFELGHGCTSDTYRSISVSGLTSVAFRQDGAGVWTPMFGRYATLSFASSTWTYTAPDGTVVLFSNTLGGGAFWARITQITRPSGEVINYHYSGTGPTARLQSVTNNFGYQIHLSYNDVANTLRVTAINNAVEYCAPTANTCALTQLWPYLEFSQSGADYLVTDALGNVTRFIVSAVPCGPNCGTNQRITGVRRPTASSGQNLTFTYNIETYPSDTTTEIETVSNGTGTWTYTFVGTDPPNQTGFVTATIVDPLSHSTEVQTWSASSEGGQDPPVMTGAGVEYVEDALGNVTDYVWDHASGLGDRIASITYPEGNSIAFSYDTRGNITQRREIAKPASGLADIVTSATYAPSCSNLATCNQPLTYTDANGNVWSMTYFAHGGIDTVTAPAVQVAGQGSPIAPQTRYTYLQRNAAINNSGGSIIQVTTPVWRLTETSQCQTTTSCNGTADEVETVTGYQQGAAGVASNILPLTVTTRAGGGSNPLSATVTTSWSMNGDPLSVDGPRPSIDDVTHYRYDRMRRRVGEIAAAVTVGADTRRPSVRTTYNADGQVTNVERGTLPQTLNVSPTPWDQGFTTLENTATTYDTRGLKTRDTVSIGGVAQRVTQYGYYANNLAECTAVRMNPAVFGSLPSNACTLGTAGANGPDRIARSEYDAANRVTTEWRAWGVTTGNGFPQTLQQEYARYTYSNNGQRLSVRDANNNRSEYVYNGFDRLIELHFPVATPLGTNLASTTDYEGYEYDPNGNRTLLRLRSYTPGNQERITYNYDALNRQTSLVTPTTSTADDVFYGYDLLGRRLHARYVSQTALDGVVYTYDALARVKTEALGGRTLSYEYDLANNRTRVTYPDANYIAYTYDVLNRMDQVQENGATSGAGLLGGYTYDFLSRPTQLAFGNAASTALAYDTDSQDWSYTQNLASTPEDLTVAFTRNPAAQTLSRDISNPLYSYGPGALNQSYSRNGLNQYTNVGGATFAYAGAAGLRGNLTSDGTRTFAYDLENRLTSVTGPSSTTLVYDPLGRLNTITAGGAATTFLYSGDQLVAEYNAGGTLLRRYAFGAGVDRPITWYEGAALNATTRRWLHADELGSVIGASDSNGELVADTAYRYGPYGEPHAWTGPGGAMLSRFRYTGQIALPEAQLYHYKARVYDPTLGRFLQTDPVGYEEGLNLYAYVENDPVNWLDPSGLEPCVPPVPVANVGTVYAGGAPCPTVQPPPQTTPQPTPAPSPRPSPRPAPRPQVTPTRPQLIPGWLIWPGVFYFVFNPEFYQNGAKDECLAVLYCNGQRSPYVPPPGRLGGVTTPELEAECEAQFDEDAYTCEMLKMYGREQAAICYGTARVRQSECLARGGREHVTTPLYRGPAERPPRPRRRN